MPLDGISNLIRLVITLNQMSYQVHVIPAGYCCLSLLFWLPGNAEDKNVPTLVQALGGHKMVDVDCGSGDAHTLALEDNGSDNVIEIYWVVCYTGSLVSKGRA